MTIKDVDQRETASGLEVRECYDGEDLVDFVPKEALGKPGEYPFTRGVYKNMYRGRVWTMRQYAGFGTPAETNEYFKYLLEQGQTGLSVALDLPTQMGLDSDASLAQDEVGRVGVAIDSLADMEALFAGIPIDRISTNFTINGTAAIILAMYIVAAEKKGCSREQISGTVQNDMIKEFLSRNTFIFPIKESLQLAGDIIEYCATNYPRFNPISVSGYHIRELGANAIQEVALTLLAAITYVEEVKSRGIAVDDFAPRLSFQLGASTDFFEEVAKFRVARRLWARIMRESYQIKNPKGMKFRVFSGGNGISLTAREPLNNIIRGTLQCLIGVLGGAQAIHVPAYDEAFAIPTPQSARIALRTQQIIAEETGIPNTVDPLGGSYYLETLANDLEDAILALIDRIEKAGGLVKAIQQGTIQNEVLEQAYRAELQVQKGEKTIVGLNKYVSDTDEEETIPIFNVSPDILQHQLNSLEKVKAERHNAGVQRELQRLGSAALEGENVMPYIIDAVKQYATVGEIASALKSAWGEYLQQP